MIHSSQLRLMLACAALLSLALGSSSARAFSGGTLFGAAPGAGGGGGFYYTGAPADRGWTCHTCHLDAPGALRVGVGNADGLFETHRYTPDAAYPVTVRISNEALGLEAGTSNLNGMALRVVDEEGQPAGLLSGFSDTEFVRRGNTTIASTAGTSSEWSFTWTAPPAGAGRVRFYIAVVDGNGGAPGPSGSDPDPLGDDVALGVLVLDEE